MARRFDIVFFDATDTLVRVRGSVGELYAAAAERHGLRVAPAGVDTAFHAAIRAAPSACFPNAAASEIPKLERGWWHAVVARTFETFGPFPRFEAFFEEVFEMFRTPAAWELLPGAAETLFALQREGRRLGIVSDMDSRLLDLLQAIELRVLFDPIVLSTQAGASKRDGTLFPHALARAGVPPERAAHVGDSLTADVHGARAAGLTAIWFDPHGASAPPEIPVARNWLEVPVRLRELEAASGDYGSSTAFS